MGTTCTTCSVFCFFFRGRMGCHVISNLFMEGSVGEMYYIHILDYTIYIYNIYIYHIHYIHYIEDLQSGMFHMLLGVFRRFSDSPRKCSGQSFMYNSLKSWENSLGRCQKNLSDGAMKHCNKKSSPNTVLKHNYQDQTANCHRTSMTYRKNTQQGKPCKSSCGVCLVITWNNRNKLEKPSIITVRDLLPGNRLRVDFIHAKLLGPWGWETSHL